MAIWSVTTFAVVFIAVLYYLLRNTFDSECLRNKRVVITGASRGLGEQLAYRYASLGARVLITARTESRLKEVMTNCQTVAGENDLCSYTVHDLSDIQSAKSLIQDAENILGGIDLLVLNHIVSHEMGPWMGSSANHTHLDLVTRVNFWSYIHTFSHALPLLERSRGQVIVINSLTGKVPQPYIAAYSACKAAIGAFFDSVRQELLLRSSNVSITQVVLALIGTETALEKMRNFKLDKMVDYLKPSSPADAASYIVEGASGRPWEVHYPYFQNVFLCMFRDVIPRPLAYLQRMFYAR